MGNKLFAKLWKDALTEPNKELYIAGYGYPEWFNEISKDISSVVCTLENIHDVAHMSIHDILSRSEMTQNAFATKFCIPIRTVEDWASGKRKCADYVRLMICRELGLLEV